MNRRHLKIRLYQLSQYFIPYAGIVLPHGKQGHYQKQSEINGKISTRCAWIDIK